MSVICSLKFSIYGTYAYLKVGTIPQRLNACHQFSISVLSDNSEKPNAQPPVKCFFMADIYRDPSLSLHFITLLSNQESNVASLCQALICLQLNVCVRMCVNSSLMRLHSPTSLYKGIITSAKELPWLILKALNPCLTQLDSQPPFENSLHSQLWGAAHRGLQKHLQTWNGVWDLCSDYTGTSWVHILSHDSLSEQLVCMTKSKTFKS